MSVIKRFSPIEHVEKPLTLIEGRKLRLLEITARVNRNIALLDELNKRIPELLYEQYCLAKEIGEMEQAND